MQIDSDASDLSGRLLVAMPSMGDPRFSRSVVFVCAHSEDGAMGLIVNKPASELDPSDLMRQLEIEVAPDARPIRVHFGGPVECGRGFVLHSSDYGEATSTLQVGERFGMTATLDILHDIAQGAGPEAAILALGYAGWGPGQLEVELQENGWLVCDASSEIVFGERDDRKWNAALESLGIDALLLSSEGGHA
ncbi:YqgE/AlgH family protein [Roseitranquillus sediminis]|uniref:YqgE/AlgH family protein n=1 Tax=Roseitranquillus sediminis TaxID=2809051 RepID=UPI001D0CCA1E|nr:YqgE/AlgH family protein [Roseitranquillus sediminis]MBM9593336.1 YqgE/AlgH family protein [Roseitranquillus sediminis]